MLVIHDLAALVAVADGGSVRKAASTLGRTQPAVTQAIHRLEEAVAIRLLDRSGYRARLTPEGATFVKRARALINEAHDLRAFAEMLSVGVESRLRIAVHGAIPAEVWVGLVRDLPSRYPDTVVEIRMEEGNAPFRRLSEGAADLAIVVGPYTDGTHPEVQYQRLGEMAFVNVVSAAHLTAPEDEVLSRLPQILVADFEDPDTGFGVVEGHRHWRVNDHRAKAEAIAAGIGWGAVPAALVQSHIDRGALRTVAYRQVVPRSLQPITLCRRMRRAFGPVCAAVWEAAEVQELVATG